MKFRREHQTKSGDALLVRSLCEADAEQALYVFKKSAGETLNMMRYPDEWAMTVEQERAFIKKEELGAKSLLLGAFVGGQLVGISNFTPVSPVDRARHRAGVGMVVLRTYWHQGIGSAMMQALIEAAQQTSLEQLELSVVDTNEGAIALYKKHGFVEYGRHPRMMKYRDGRYADALLMMLDLRRKP